MEKELTVESLLKAKGFADAAVTLHSGAVNVILSAESLSEEQVAQVLDIVMRETGEPGGQRKGHNGTVNANRRGICFTSYQNTGIMAAKTEGG